MKLSKRISFMALCITLAGALLTAFAAAPASAAGKNTEPKNCSSNKDCATDEFCDTTPKCPGKTIKGACVTKPQFCTEDYKPVKACNGKEYSNRCHAAADGQAIIRR